MSRSTPLMVGALLIATLALAGCSNSSAGPFAPSGPPETPSLTVDRFVTSFVENFTIDFFDDCTGEVVHVNGVVRFREQAVSPPLTFHRTFQILNDGSGIGETSGLRYQFHLAHVFAIDFGGFNAEVTERDDALLISQGSGGNGVIETLLHVTLTPNGEITASLDKVSFICRG